MNAESNYFDVETKPFIVKRGYRTIIKASISSITETDPNLEHGMTIEERRCRFPHEVPENMTLFKEYTLQACVFDCMFMYSWKTCDCIPWDMPRPDDTDNVPVCTEKGYSCFYSNMKNPLQMSKGCYCAPSCESIQYNFFHDQIPLSTTEICDNMLLGDSYATDTSGTYGSDLSTNINSRLYYTRVSFDHLKEYLKYYDPIDPKEASYYRSSYKLARSINLNHEMCRKWLVNDLAIIEFSMSNKPYLKIHQSARISFSDQLGTIGGTLGLFCGLSVLTLVEIIYWIFITVKNIFGLK